MVVRIRDITHREVPLDVKASVSAALQRFLSSADLDTLPIADGGVVVGVALRARLMDLTLSSGGMDALFRQPIETFMTRTFETVDVASSISKVCSQSKTVQAGERAADLLAMEDGTYFGIVPLGRLLKAVSTVNLARARAMKNMQDALAAAEKQAEGATQADNQFVALVGHEIRTPLTGILGVAELLCDARLEKKQQALAETIVRSGHHLDRLLDDLLDLSRLQAGKVEIVPTAFDVKEFGRETRSLWQARGEKNDVALSVNVKAKTTPRIVADATRMRQILFNLVSNAIKFSKGGKVDVSLETRQNVSNATELVMTVTDTGTGIADADKTRLFKAFEQAGPDTQLTHGGTGLGLAIAKGLIDRMRGTIELADNPDGGAVFRVVCPVGKAAPQLATQQSKPRKRSGNFQLGRVLIVDDHEISRFVMSQALRAAGWQVDAVATRAQAERRLAEVSYQIAIFDLHLEDASGGELLEWLRAGASPNKFLPALAVSAEVGAESEDACKRSGFDGFVAKPIRPRQLVASVADLIVTNTEDRKLVRRLQAG